MRKIIDLAEAWVLKYVDPILLYGVGLLVVAGFTAASRPRLTVIGETKRSSRLRSVGPASTMFTRSVLARSAWKLLLGSH